MRVLTRVDTGSFVKFYTVMMAIFGAIAGLFAALGSLALTGMGGSDAAQVGAFGGVFAIIVMPIVYALFGLIGGFITVTIMNLVLKVTKGIKFETSEAQMMEMTPSSPVKAPVSQ